MVVSGAWSSTMARQMVRLQEWKRGRMAPTLQHPNKNTLLSQRSRVRRGRLGEQDRVPHALLKGTQPSQRVAFPSFPQSESAMARSTLPQRATLQGDVRIFVRIQQTPLVAPPPPSRPSVDGPPLIWLWRGWRPVLARTLWPWAVNLAPLRRPAAAVAAAVTAAQQQQSSSGVTRRDVSPQNANARVCICKRDAAGACVNPDPGKAINSSSQVIILHNPDPAFVVCKRGFHFANGRQGGSCRRHYISLLMPLRSSLFPFLVHARYGSASAGRAVVN
jgi:hypothetical protein